ncbi:MAG: U32 family peptidase [Clostridiales Family XIII bacterium]|jgi:putative protease|nr:U32 family peptidase [Clostridiales Family XIII bacterium]
MNLPEILAPAGDMEKLKTAVLYGADAVYFGGEIGSLRAKAGNFGIDEIFEGVKYCHDVGVKAYLTLNIYAHETDLSEVETYILAIKDAGIDAYIVSDPGIIYMLKDLLKDARDGQGPDIHLSTQSNTTNSASIKFWQSQGISRIVLARELTLEEIREIHEQVPDVELETFVHGAMCISYSGRCLLSNYMIGRDANKGECAHPCRWNYALVEEKRPGEYYPVYEDERGTYIMNSKDIAMINHLPDLIDVGVTSFKIEGRMKSAYYVATVIKAYRLALDLVASGMREDNPVYQRKMELIMKELVKTSHREFITGFFYHKPAAEDHDYGFNGYTREYSFIGSVISYDPKTSLIKLEQRNKFEVGETIEIFEPYRIEDTVASKHDIDDDNMYYVNQAVVELFDEDMNPVDSAPHAQQVLYLKVDRPIAPNSLMRKAL